MEINIHCTNANKAFIVMNAISIRSTITNVNLEKENIITFTFNKEENAENFCCQIYNILETQNIKIKKTSIPSVPVKQDYLRFKL